MRRVVVTGLGLVTPLGCGVQVTWDNLVAGKSGIRQITHIDVSDIPAKVAGVVPRRSNPGEFNPDNYIEPKEQKKMDDFIHFAFGAATQAVEDAGIAQLSDEQKLRTGVMIGSGIGGLPIIEETVLLMKEKGARRVSPFFVPASIINMISGHVSIKYGFKGPNHAVVTACSTGAHSIGDAARMIRDGDADVMLAGGAESTINPLGVAGFAQARALNCSYNDRPEQASRPYDKDRDGFVMGEGAGVVVLEEYEHAKARGAKIYAEVVGYGLSGDAYHVTAPHPEGKGAELSMRMALKKAGMGPGDIDYVNAHGTSTMADTIELGAVKRVLGDDLTGASMSSTKSAIGHLLGGAGAVEAIFCILAIRDQVVPPTLNLDNPDEGTEGVDLVPKVAKKRKVRAVLNNSFGFGGTNASLVMKAVED